MILFCLLHALAPLPNQGAYLLSGLCGLFASTLLFIDLRFSAKIQVGILFGIGSVFLLYAYQHGTTINLVDAISRNALLVSMILSVGFLRLLLETEDNPTVLPRGRRAYLNTLVALGVFGSVINISAPIMICDRLEQEQPIDHFMARSATRVFCMCSTWSPYFAGAAVILTYVHGVDLSQVMITGLPMLLMTIVGVYWVAVRFNQKRVDRFIGYPMSASKLWLPIAVTLLVLSTQAFLPEVPILIAISLSALLLTIGVLVWRTGLQSSVSTLSRHVSTGLPRSVNELLLFLSAGVLATGLTAFVETSLFDFDFPSFTYQSACITLAGMIIISALGIHPVIQISALTPLLITAGPDPELLAITYLFAWGLGTAASPLSGTHMVFQGRYGIPAWKGALQNWPFVFSMYFVAIGLLGLHVHLT